MVVPGSMLEVVRGYVSMATIIARIIRSAGRMSLMYRLEMELCDSQYRESEAARTVSRFNSIRAMPLRRTRLCPLPTRYSGRKWLLVFDRLLAAGATTRRVMWSLTSPTNGMPAPPFSTFSAGKEFCRRQGALVLIKPTNRWAGQPVYAAWFSGGLRVIAFRTRIAGRLAPMSRQQAGLWYNAEQPTSFGQKRPHLRQSIAGLGLDILKFTGSNARTK